MKYILCIVVMGFIYAISGNSQSIDQIKIGNQIWMMSNLNKNTTGSWNYNEDQNLGKKYGRLYSYESAKNSCPSGWNLPTMKDWDELISVLGGEQ